MFLCHSLLNGGRLDTNCFKLLITLFRKCMNVRIRAHGVEALGVDKPILQLKIIQSKTKQLSTVGYSL